MLYVTTRNNRDGCTAAWPLSQNRGADGGRYLPFRGPSFSPEEWQAMAQEGFQAGASAVLNRLFRLRLSKWDMDCCIGRKPVHLKQLGQKVFLAQCWHNPDRSYGYLEKHLAQLVGSKRSAPTNWVRIAVRTAILFGIWAELSRQGVPAWDVSLVSGSFSWPMAAWYARDWGLPVGNIVCGCNENHSIWDLFCHGQLRTDTVCFKTSIPEADVALPGELERLVYQAGGPGEVERYLDCCRQGGVYAPEAPVLDRLRQGMYVSVVSSQRIAALIPSVRKSHGYTLEPPAALAYGALMDYRAKHGQTRPAVLISLAPPANL